MVNKVANPNTETLASLYGHGRYNARIAVMDRLGPIPSPSGATIESY